MLSLPRTTSANALEPIVTDLDATLSDPAALNDRAPDAMVYRIAIRRQGRAHAEIGGRAAMRRAMRRVADLAPERSAHRKAVIDEAWASLPGWYAIRPANRKFFSKCRAPADVRECLSQLTEWPRPAATNHLLSCFVDTP